MVTCPLRLRSFACRAEASRPRAHTHGDAVSGFFLHGDRLCLDHRPPMRCRRHVFQMMPSMKGFSLDRRSCMPISSFAHGSARLKLRQSPRSCAVRVCKATPPPPPPPGARAESFAMGPKSDVGRRSTGERKKSPRSGKRAPGCRKGAWAKTMGHYRRQGWLRCIQDVVYVLTGLVSAETVQEFAQVLRKVAISRIRFGLGACSQPFHGVFAPEARRRILESTIRELAQGHGNGSCPHVFWLSMQWIHLWQGRAHAHACSATEARGVLLVFVAPIGRRGV